ncbi:hypothetical protein [Acinetobacter zhairhuonensis]|uniref:hypothetical protein n=1 Tax=Acinetobacter sp. A7.4 TaxID=2919921 RepID=UPI001F4F3383|nr:hypothetical protein [Acinetobacter sp. A7.4]MCJ8161668.1 hypothetical protein [Acinetobacter sp. A7.4]
MRLYVQDEKDGKKIYLNYKVRNRGELQRIVGSEKFKLNGNVYKVNAVRAEMDNNSFKVAAGIGSLIGVLGGVPGVLAGALIGGVVGGAQLETEKKNVESFNASN